MSLAAPAAAEGRALAIAAMIGSAAAWGGATVMTKGLLETVPPFTLLAVQLTASVAVLWAAVLLTRTRPALALRTLGAAWPGVLEPGLAYGVGVPGLMLTSATSAAVIGAAEPAFIALAAWLLLGHRPSGRLAGAVAAAFAGVLLMAGPGGGGRAHAGDALVVLGTAFAALYVILSSRAVTGIAPLPLAAVQQTAGLAVALVTLATAILLGVERVPAAIAPHVLALAAVSGIVQYALAFWLYLLGLRRLPVGTAGMFLALIPVFGILGSVLFLGERPTGLQLAGSALVVASVVAIARRG